MKFELISKITESQKQLEALNIHVKKIFPSINFYDSQDFCDIMSQHDPKIKELNLDSSSIKNGNLDDFSEELLNELLKIFLTSIKNSLDWINKIEDITPAWYKAKVDKQI